MENCLKSLQSIYIYIWKNGRSENIIKISGKNGESDKIIKINGKMDKSNTYYGFRGNISFFMY